MSPKKEIGIQMSKNTSLSLTLISEKKIFKKNMPENKFKALVKRQAIEASIKYLKQKQRGPTHYIWLKK